MKNKIYSLLFVLIICLSTTASAFATDTTTDGFSDEYYRVLDMADLLTESEETTLIEKLDEISIRQSMDVVVATTDDLEGFSVVEYADLLYEECNFGYGDANDGLLLLISMQDRDWHISTTGFAITAFTDAGIQYIGKKMKPDLSAGNYASAFDTYATLCDEFITQADTESPYDSGNLPKDPLSPIWILISIVVGVLISVLIVLFMKSSLKTVRYQAAASDYVKSGSINIIERRDMFLYHTVTKTEKPKDNSGSSTHTSSSGTTHGGGGGKF